MDFTEKQLERYSRHIILPEVGGKGQKKILAARVLLVGAGGLGCPAGYYLAAAGVGTLGIVDDDKVELSNLQRQIAHNVDRLGVSKADSAKKTFEALNPDVSVVPVKKRINCQNILEIIDGYDIVVDGTDNFPTRYLINDACILSGKPLVSGAILRFGGQVTTIIPGKGHCYRCQYGEPPRAGDAPSCQEAGVLGVLPGIIGSLQAMEVLKIILGKGEPLSGFYIEYDALKAEFKKRRVPRMRDCEVCGENPKIVSLEAENYRAEVCSL